MKQHENRIICASFVAGTDQVSFFCKECNRIHRHYDLGDGTGIFDPKIGQILSADCPLNYPKYTVRVTNSVDRESDLVGDLEDWCIGRHRNFGGTNFLVNAEPSETNEGNKLNVSFAASPLFDDLSEPDDSSILSIEHQISRIQAQLALVIEQFEIEQTK